MRQIKMEEMINISQICASDVLVYNLNAAVVVPLKDGLCCIDRVYKALTEGDVDPINGQCSNYNYIREQIEQAQQSLKKSEHMAATELKSLDEKIETLTRDEGKLEEKMNVTKQTLEILKIKQTSNVKTLSDSEGSLELANSNLSSTKDVHQKLEERRDNATIVRNVGLGVTLIPIVGWVVGPAMIIAGEIEISQASDAIKEADKQVRTCKREVKKYKRKVSKYESKICKTERGIKKKHKKAGQLHEEVQKVKQIRKVIAELQGKLRSVVHNLGVLSAKIRVTEVQTRKFILQQPVMKVIEDLMKTSEEIKTWLPSIACKPRSKNEKSRASCIRVPFLSRFFHLYSRNRKT